MSLLSDNMIVQVENLMDLQKAARMSEFSEVVFPLVVNSRDEIQL